MPVVGFVHFGDGRCPIHLEVVKLLLKHDIDLLIVLLPVYPQIVDYVECEWNSCRGGSMILLLFKHIQVHAATGDAGDFTCTERLKGDVHL